MAREAALRRRGGTKPANAANAAVGDSGKAAAKGEQSDDEDARLTVADDGDHTMLLEGLIMFVIGCVAGLLLVYLFYPRLIWIWWSLLPFGRNVVPERTAWIKDTRVALGLPADDITVLFHRNGGNATDVKGLNVAGVRVRVNASSDTIEDVAQRAAEALGIAPDLVSAVSRWPRVFSSAGVELAGVDALEDGQVAFLVAEREFFFWPGLYEGFKTEVPGVTTHDGSALVMGILSMRPRVFHIPNFLSAEECDVIVARADTQMERSGVYLTTKESSHISDVRTSSQTWLYDIDEALVERVSRRVAELTRTPVSLQEAMQVVRYDVGQSYHSHYDYFDPKRYPDREDLQRGRQRMITVLYYLNDVPAGGETVFPYAATNNGYVWGSDWIRDSSDCTRGLLVPPRRGDAVLFYSVVSQGHMAGALDERSLHGGCPVHAGVKWLSNKWVYNML